MSKINNYERFFFLNCLIYEVKLLYIIDVNTVAKSGKEATLLLRRDVAKLFVQWFDEGGFSPNDRVSPKFNKSTGAAMLRRDLEAAGVDYEDEAGRFADFHSLRHTFISNVGKSGATVKEAQRLARHSTSALTLDVYTHIGLHDERQAVEKLPPLHNTDEEDLKKNQAVALRTGTDNKPVEIDQIPQNKLTPTTYSGCNQSTAVGNQTGNPPETAISSNCLPDGELGTEKNTMSSSDITGAGGIRTPGTFRYNGFQDRRLKPLGHCSTYFKNRVLMLSLSRKLHPAMLQPILRSAIQQIPAYSTQDRPVLQEDQRQAALLWQAECNCSVWRPSRLSRSLRICPVQRKGFNSAVKPPLDRADNEIDGL